MKLPIEFVDRMKNVLGEEYAEFEKSYGRPVNCGIRINTLKISVKEFLEISPFKLINVPWAKTGFYIDKEEKPAKHPYYHAGLYYIQEPSAMAPVEFIDIKPGDKVLDLCAAPGGKTTQILSKLGGEGLLVSNDNNRNRTKALVRNIELCGAKNIAVTNEVPEKLVRKFEGFFDKILVDAPCSGEGMFGKDENAVKSWETFTPERCSVMQREILKNASKMLKPNGNILYSTCTFSLIENEEIIDRFLKDNNDFEIVELSKRYGISNGKGDLIGNPELNKAIRFWPHKLQGEGHFLALLRKKDDNNIKAFSSNKTNNKMDLGPFEDFRQRYLNINFNGKFEMIGEYLYSVHTDLPDHSDLNVIRPGWFLGTNKKGRFEPSHGLALALKKHQAKNVIDFESNSDFVIKYLKGETLEIEANKGYNLITVDGYSLGWAKGMDSILKNEYSVAWRLT